MRYCHDCSESDVKQYPISSIQVDIRPVVSRRSAEEEDVDVKVWLFHLTATLVDSDVITARMAADVLQDRVSQPIDIKLSVRGPSLGVKISLFMSFKVDPRNYRN